MTAVIIIKITEKEYTVNNKRCYLDMNDNWIANSLMNAKEISAFQRHLLKHKKIIS